ncbi:MAG: folate-binding protein [Thermosynechococcaceae cyanobacterium]
MSGLPDDQCTQGDPQAIAAAQTAVALHDRSHWGRLRVFDRDRLSFLHNQSSNDFKGLLPGQGCEAVILTSTARTLDLVSAYVNAEDVLLLTSPNQASALLAWFDRYIFFGDKVQLADLTDTTVCFSLIGPQSAEVLATLGITDLPQDLNHHGMGAIAGVSVQIAVGSGLSLPGYTLIADRTAGVSLWQALAATGAIPLSQTDWEQLRILEGRPMPGSELTEDYNPLEAGLWHTVSLNKGCYIGQETIARLNTYNGVKQQLWGIALEGESQVGELIYGDAQKIGVLTSIVRVSQGSFGLGYIKTKAGGAGLTVHIGASTGTVVEVPFLSRCPQTERSV